MACASEDIHHVLCATHRGEIASFEAQSEVISDPCEFEKLFAPREDGTARDLNLSRLMRKGATIAAGAVIGGAAFRVLGAAHAGAKGVAMGYKGAVATKVGWAKLGGGALAKGGFGIAGGKARLAATMVGQGTWRSWSVANTYFSDLAGFKVRKVRDGCDPALICINGFRTEEQDEIASKIADEEWLKGLGDEFSDRAVYRVQWPATKRHDFVDDAGRVVQKLKSGVRLVVGASSASHEASNLARLPALVGGAASAFGRYDLARLYSEREEDWFLAGRVAQSMRKPFIHIDGPLTWCPNLCHCPTQIFEAESVWNFNQN